MEGIDTVIRNLKRDRAYHRQQLNKAEPVGEWRVPEEWSLTEDQKEKHRQSIRFIDQKMWAIRNKHVKSKTPEG